MPHLSDLPLLEKLDLRWNPLTELPDRVAHLRGRGCVVLT